MMLMLPLPPMQQAQSFAHPHQLSSQRMTTSLVIAPALRSQQQQSSSPTRSTRPKPKLSLNTAQTRTFGKGSSLRLETLSAVSPTIINTFANAYEPPKTVATEPARPTRPKLSIDSSVRSESLDSPDTPEFQQSRTPSSSSISSASTVHSATIPYSISQALNSILSNGPLPRATPRKMSARPKFPAQKKVSFRTPLVEEITTSKYTYANSDVEMQGSDSLASLSTDSISSEEIASESTSLVSSDSFEPSSLSSSSQSMFGESYPYSKSNSNSNSTSSTDSSPSPPPTAHRLAHRLNRTRLKGQSPRTGEKRDSSSESDSDSCPETPVAGRRKRRREWVWTLDPLPSQQTFSEDAHSVSTDQSSSTSNSITFTSSIASSSTTSDDSS